MLFQGLDTAKKQAVLYGMMAIAEDEMTGIPGFSAASACAASYPQVPALTTPAQHGGMSMARGTPAQTVSRAFFQSAQPDFNAAANFCAAPAAPPAPAAPSYTYAPVSDAINLANGWF